MRKNQKYAILTYDQKLEIVSLRRTGRTNHEICEIFREEYKMIIYEEQIDRIYSEYYKDFLGEPRFLIEVSDDEIYKLIEQGLTNEDIFEHYKSKNVKCTRSSVTKRCIIILIKKWEIFRLINEDKTSFAKITKFLNKRGFKVTEPYIYNAYMSFISNGDAIQLESDSDNDEKTLEELNETLNEELQRKRYLEEMISILEKYIKNNLERE